ncbi:MAG: LPS export ABC transporter periplasmic protein LptC [Thiotrichales bacterium]|nr:LPS export ABC transporter periplasmic protein LptC [Thiotrichales bacterium]MCY4348534.1 LPS export ABC transporter periplasmic protein LptC [Thiotrichales bacterium]
MAPVLRWVLYAALLAVAGTSAWFLYAPDFGDHSAEGASADAPEAYMENFVSVEMDSAGRPGRRVEASYMAFQADRTVELTDPRYVLFRDDGEPWHVQSELGRVSPDGTVLWLIGKVDVWRNDASGTRDLDIQTEHLMVLTASEYGETAEPVTIRTPTGTTSGVGMRAWLGETRFELLSQVRTHVDGHNRSQ